MHCVCEPSTLHFPAASAEHLGVTSLLRGEKVSPSGGISHPRRGWGDVPPPGFGFRLCPLDKEGAGDLCCRSVWHCGGCPGLVTAVAGVPWDWTWKIKIKPSLQR